MKKSILLWMCVMAGLLSMESCKKESNTIQPDPFYSYTVSGFEVQFKNLSRFATSYVWYFGDGDSSTEANPTHIYPHKGKYVPTLVAIGTDGRQADASTVLHIAKGSSVNLNDGTLSDWDTIAHNVVIAGKNAGNFVEAKYDYDGNYLYVYFAQIAKQSDGDIYDIYIDMDNNASTGFLSTDLPGGGYDVLLEGTVLGGWLDPYQFSGATQSSFSWSNLGINSYYTVGDIQQSGDTLKFEFGIDRSKVKGLSSTTGIKVFVNLSNNSWSTIGYSPDQGQNAFFLDMSE